MSSTETNPDKPAEFWSSNFNKALIAIGVIAFGLIVTDRLLEAFKADNDDPVEEASFQLLNEKTEADALLSQEASDESNSTGIEGKEALVELENIFGSRVVFVSASEPAYVVTEDERRFEVGSAVNKDTTLAGIMADQLILEQSGDVLFISLPDPEAVR